MVQSLKIHKESEKLFPKISEKLDQIKMPPLEFIEYSENIINPKKIFNKISSKDFNINNQAKNEEIVLVPTPIDYEQYMKMQYSKDFSKFEESSLNDFNKNNFQGGLIHNNLKDLYFNQTNFLQPDQSSLFNYADQITQNAHFDMGFNNNKPVIESDSNLNFMEKNLQKITQKNFKDDIDVNKFMKSQEDEIQKYFDKLNKLEYEKVYNRINNVNKEQEAFDKIKNSDGNIDFNEIWREFQINNTNKVNKII